MVRLLSRTELEDGFLLDEYAGKSTDNKPSFLSLATGSTFIAVDTGKVYMYEEEAPEWYELGGESDG